MASKKQDALVQFGDFTLDDLEEHTREAAQNAPMKAIWPIPQGKSIVRVLPPRKGEKLMKVAYVHYIDVPGVGRVSFNCPRLMAKRPCPVCAQEAKLMSTGEDVDFRKARKLSAKRRLFMPIIVRGEEDNGPRLLAFGKMIEDQLVEIRKDEDDGGNFAHPGAEGFDLKISRTGEGPNDTKYKVSKTGGNKPLSDDADQMREWIESQPSAERYLRVLDDDAIEALLRGESVGESEERPRSRRPQAQGGGSTRSKKAVADEIEDGEIVFD